MEQFPRKEKFHRIFKALKITPSPNPIERHFAILRSRVSLYSFSPYSFIQNGRYMLLCQCRSILAAFRIPFIAIKYKDPSFNSGDDRFGQKMLLHFSLVF